MSIASWMSPPASAFTFPISRVIRSASDALSRFKSSAKRKRMLPRSGAGTRRQSSQAARAIATARSTSAAVDRVNVSISSPVEGFRDSKVAVAIQAIVATALIDRRFGRQEHPGRPGAPAIADHALLLDVFRRLELSAVGAGATVDDDRHVGVVAVVRDEPVEQ